MQKKIFYWSPFFSDIATIKAVLNSVISVKKFSRNNIKPYIINVFGEWDDYRETIFENEIDIINLNLHKFFKKKKINGFFLSRYYQIKIFILAFFPLLNALKKGKPDILIIHLLTSLPLFLNFLFEFKFKTILRISGLPKLNIIRKLFWKIVIKKINIITTPTNATKIHLQNLFDKKKIYLLRDPILNIKEIQQKQKNFKNYKPEKNIYVSIGRLTKQKNFIFLLNCFKKIIKKNRDNYLYILGDGENFNELEKFIKVNDLKKNIFLEGYKDNVYEYLKKANAFILTSLWEDPGFVLIEACYSNTTIISSDCENGPKEIVNKNQNGFLFESNNYDSFFDVFETFQNTNLDDVKIKKINAKKMSREFSLFRHYLQLKHHLK